MNKKILLTILFIVLIGLSGCGNRDTFESECYGNCIDANNCISKRGVDYIECKTACFDSCYNQCKPSQEEIK